MNHHVEVLNKNWENENLFCKKAPYLQIKEFNTEKKVISAMKNKEAPSIFINL